MRVLTDATKNQTFADMKIREVRIVHGARGFPIRNNAAQGHTKPTGIFMSRKCGRAMPWESFHELHLMWISECDTAVRRFLVQPLRLEIYVRNRANPIMYFPDVERRFDDGVIEVVEVKKTKEEVGRDPFYALKIEMAKKVFRTAQYRFRIMTAEDHIEIELRLGNAKTIKFDRSTKLETVDIIRLQEALAHARGSVAYGKAIEVLKLYASEGRPSIPPEQLLSALLLQVLYGIRSERQLKVQLDYNRLYRWFVGLAPDDPVRDPTTFTKNRERLQNGDIFTKFMISLPDHEQVKPLLSDEHFSVDATLIEAWASQKSFRPKDGSGDTDDGANFHGQKRKNDTHASTSDPDRRLYRKAAGREAKPSYMGHAVMENRRGLAVAGMVTHANGTTERRAAEIMLEAKSKAAGRRITAGGDKAYDTADHVAHLRARNVTPHLTQNNGPTKTGKSRRSAIDERTTRHEGYGMSQSRRP